MVEPNGPSERAGRVVLPNGQTERALLSGRTERAYRHASLPGPVRAVRGRGFVLSGSNQDRVGFVTVLW